jgi:hypothetical protein
MFSFCTHMAICKDDIGWPTRVSVACSGVSACKLAKQAFCVTYVPVVNSGQ